MTTEHLSEIRCEVSHVCAHLHCVHLQNNGFVLCISVAYRGGLMSATDEVFFHYHTILLVNRWVDEVRLSMVSYFLNLIFHSSNGSEKSVLSLVSRGVAHWVV